MKRTLIGMFAAFLAIACTISFSKADDPKRKLFFLTHSAGYEHSTVKRGNSNQLSHTEKVMTNLCHKSNIDVMCTKDCSLITAKNLKDYDAVFFYTTGDLPIPDPQDLLHYVKNGGGMIGSHPATDTFHSWIQGGKKLYIDMIGAEFATHGAQQEARVIVADPKFPAVTHIRGKDFHLLDEWYAFKNISPEIHPVLILDTKGMAGKMYEERAPYPIAWSRNYGKGRGFYTAMGHREDVWTNPLFQKHVIAGIQWAMENSSSQD